MRIAVTYNLERKLPHYEEALRAVGLEPVRLAGANKAHAADFDGILLTGGSDHGKVPERDALEERLIHEALEADVPMLGICRGLQLINVALGGTLHQDIPGHLDVQHEIRVAGGSQLAGILGARAYEVNSRHHQAADRLGEGLVVTATAADGVVEAVEMPGQRFFLAVQWHPEDRIATHPADREIFAAFARAVRR